MPAKGDIKGNEIIYQNKDEVCMKCSNTNTVFTLSPECLNDAQKVTWHEDVSIGGYIRGTIDGKMIFIHRFFLREDIEKLDNPTSIQVDHIDRNPLNNKLDNLRLVSSRINNLNKDQTDNAIVPVNGVTLTRHSGNYTASVYINCKYINIGEFKDPYDAGLVYDSYIYHNLPESEWGAMNIKQGKIPEDVLEKYNIDPNDPSTIPFIPSSKHGNNHYKGTTFNKKNNEWRAYVYNNDGKPIHVGRSKSEIESAAMRETYLIEHPELNNKINSSNINWPKETDDKINIVGIILDKDELEKETRGY